MCNLWQSMLNLKSVCNKVCPLHIIVNQWANYIWITETWLHMGWDPVSEIYPLFFFCTTPAPIVGQEWYATDSLMWNSLCEVGLNEQIRLLLSYHPPSCTAIFLPKKLAIVNGLAIKSPDLFLGVFQFALPGPLIKSYFGIPYPPWTWSIDALTSAKAT